MAEGGFTAIHRGDSTVKMPKTHKIALLFNANKIFDRGIITGIAAYLRGTRVPWDLFLEDDFRTRLDEIDGWRGDGIIADFDDPAVCAALSNREGPVVAVGGSYQDQRRYPENVPYVATDNFKLIDLAYGHLIEAGLTRFAMFSLPEASENRWAQERELAYTQLMKRDKLDVHIFRGQATRAPTWNAALEELISWLNGLPKPVGIIAVTDARARQLLQACTIAGIAVPEQVALIGIDNDPLAGLLTRIPLSSVIQGTEEMGKTAAYLLHQMLNGKRFSDYRTVVPPLGLNVLASSKHEALVYPHVMRALHFIRQYACQGIKSEQVADYVGISRSSLDSHFRDELGRTVHDEILRFKLEAATASLTNQHCNIAELAVSCGFTSVQYMHAVFKRELGCTPRKYQQRAALEPGAAAIADPANLLANAK